MFSSNCCLCPVFYHALNEKKTLYFQKIFHNHTVTEKVWVLALTISCYRINTKIPSIAHTDRKILHLFGRKKKRIENQK